MSIKETSRYKIFKQVLDSKNYDLLYTLFGKTIYNLFTPFSHMKEDINKLMDNKDYGTIYNKYGTLRQLFIKNFRIRKKEDIKRLINEGKLLELYDVYGEKIFNSHLKEIYEKDVERETGNKKKAISYKKKYSITHGLKNVVASLLSFTVTTPAVVGQLFLNESNKAYNNALINYSSMIEEYNNKITDYSYEINSLDLDSDLEVVMKVMYDMWSEMEGYGNPEIDPIGINRLAFTNPGGVGVCRNIADDFTARMNAINPEYNARNLVVYFDSSNYTKDSLSNIERNVKTEDTVEQSNEFDDMLTNTIGNHMVSIFNPIGKDYTLVVDATNPSIGIINNGDIYMFSTIEGKGIKYKTLGQNYMAKDASLLDTNLTFLKSIVYKFSDDELVELNSEWGVDAQNQALEKVRQSKRTY